MAASSKFDFSSSSSDGPTPTSGQRGPHIASLDRSGSFREAAENRISSTLPGTSRTGSVLSQGDPVGQLQSLVSDLKTTVFDQNFPRTGELKRSINSILGVPQEDSLPATYTSKVLSSSSFEEIRRLRNNLHEGSVRARERTKAFGEAVLKMEKYTNLSRKRSRTDNSSSERSNLSVQGGSTPKTRPQSHPAATSLEIGPPKSEERAKGGAPSRKIRSSLLEVQMDARGNSSARPTGSMDRDRDVLKLVSSGATPPEEKGRALATAVDGWEKSKMKKKRSVLKSDTSGNAIMAKLPDGDREPKRGMQQKLIPEARPRLNNNHGFRSGSTIGINGVGKLESASQPNGIGIRASPRNNDQDNGSLPNDRRDRLVGADKEGATLKAALKPNGREDNYAVSPTSVMKMNTSVRGPRSSTGSLSKSASPSMNRMIGNSDDVEHPNCVNKLNGVPGTANRKRSASSRSSSPPVVHWGGQKHQKVTRVARRSNLTPVVSSRVNYLASETMDSIAANDDGLGFRRRSSTSALQHIKSRGDHVQSVLSESEESGGVDKKSKDKSKKCSELEEKAGASVQKVATLVVPSRRNKLAVEEDQEDGARRNGKSGRGGTSARSATPASSEKLDSAVTSKQMRSARINYDKIERPGRPPIKKSSERKAHTRPRHSANGAASLEFTGESDDDHDELIAAANAALNTREACSGPFWEQNVDFFRFLSAEDQEFLNEQIRLADLAAGSGFGTGDDHSLNGDLEHYSLPSTPTLSNGNPKGHKSLNECLRMAESANQTKHAEPFLEDLVVGNGAQFGVSICQTLLSAIIDEEELENSNDKSNNEEDLSYGNANGLHLEADADLKSKANLQSFGTFQDVDRAALYSYKPNTGWGYHGELVQEDLGSNGAVDELLPNQTNTFSPLSTEIQYNQMSMNDRVLLELSEIGIRLEPVISTFQPTLEQSDDEDIDKSINRLTSRLHEQVLKKKKLLLELNKAASKGGEVQQRELERIALDKLIGSAYEKYMAHQGPNGSGRQNSNRTNKQATLAFVRRTLACYRQFEETGTSCFSQPDFKDMFSFVHSHKDLLANAMASQPFTSGPHSEIPSADQSHGLASQSAPREDIHHKYSDTFRSVNHLTEHMNGREDQWSNKLKKKELLLDEVVGSATGILRASSGLGGSLVSGTKGKRSERDREGKGQNRDSRNGTAKSGRLALSNVKGERKNKSKPKQKTTQLSASVNDLLSKETETPDKISPSAPKSRDNVGGNAKNDEMGQPSFDTEAIDLSNLQLPEIDVTDFGAQGQDIESWLNIEEDGLQDLDFMGLQIPMDDLSEVMF